MQKIASVIISVVLIATLSQPAYAHRVNVFATAEGATISGYAYFAGGGRAQGGSVQVVEPNSAAVLAETTTNENGEFSFTARVRCDHRITVTLDDGHRAQYTVPADELPDTLPAFDSDAAELPAADVEHDHGHAHHDSHGNIAADEVEAMIARQIGALRRQLHEAEHRRRISDIVGGIGYIVGLCGVAFYFLGKKKRT